MTTMTKRWVAALALTFPTLAAAAEPAPSQGPALLTHEALQKRLADANIRVLDARPRAEFDKGHIAGAVWLDGQALAALANSENFENKEAWSKALAPLGINKDTEVFLYDDAKQHDAARAWWLLGYAGVKAGLIDGGFKLWEKDGRPAVKEVTSVAPREFAVEFHSKRAASRADVLEVLKSGSAVFLDARSAAEYRGETPAGAQAKPGRRQGHIPTARSFDAYDVVDADGRFLAPEVQRERLARAGISKDRPVIAYAGGGARSALVVFALRRLDIPARHYHSGLNDWLKDEANPVVTGDEPGQVPAPRAASR